MNQSIRHVPGVRFGLAFLVLTSGTGCTSVLTSASLRDLVWDGEDHAAETDPATSDAELEEGPDPVDPDEAADGEATADAQRRQAAVEEATARLARLDYLDDTARATLAETLGRTQQEDWPAVIDAFAESLADANVTPPPTAEAETITETIVAEPAAAEPAVTEAPVPDEPDAHVVAKADLDAASGDAAFAPKAAAAPEPAPAPEPAALPPADAVSTAPAESLVIENACFASRVQAWGVLDRFAADRFRPGQEVIVYFELDGLSAGESPAGHTTCIDSDLRLVDAGGSVVHAWSFEPIAETCRARRRDYFARYVVRLPETGACRVELQVTDTLSGQAATASLPLEVLPAADF